MKSISEQELYDIADGHPIRMTVEQRQECLIEIDLVEGFDMVDYVHSNDINLAKGVLAAWKSVALDKGTL